MVSVYVDYIYLYFLHLKFKTEHFNNIFLLIYLKITIINPLHVVINPSHFNLQIENIFNSGLIEGS